MMMKQFLWFGLTALFTATSACSGDGESNHSTSSGGAGVGGAGGAGVGGAGVGGAGVGGGSATVFGDDRPVELHVPDNYDAATPAPLLILLHGYTATGTVQNFYFGMQAVANNHGMLYAYPDGTVDDNGDQFWNATDACCNFFGSPVDDSAYLNKLIDDISGAYNVDPKRIYFVGHSNGGFMSYRMACDHADKVAAIASLAGATYKDPTQCAPSEPVNVLQIHGTADATIKYNGGNNVGLVYPSVQETIDYWAGVAACDINAPTDGGMIDIDGSIAGDETTVTRYETGCVAGGSATLWSMAGSGHVPQPLSATFAEQVVTYLLAHPKP
ncbi:MAG TPA: hypothetical protein ENK23_09225 [Sorangium sp.]|nr:hypothetical protein [Sorangium sp.]